MSIVEQSGQCSYVVATRQKRLRHLKSIAGRNIQYNGQNTTEISNSKIYFTLHASKYEPEFYASEKLQGSINPSWKGFNLDHIPLKEVNTTKSNFVVKIWRGKDDEYMPCITWEVNVTGLVYIGEKLQKEVDFPPNTLLFGMLNGFYIAPNEKQQPVCIKPCDYFLTADLASTRKSYSVSTLSRIQTVLRAIKQTEASGTNVRRQIEDNLSQARDIQRKKCHLEDLKSKLRQLQCDLEWRTTKLQMEKEQYETLQTRNTQQDMSQKKRYDTLKNDRSRLHERKKKYFDVREELIKNGAQLVMRRKQLISELAFIYPIRELPNNVFTIAVVSLPNSTELQAANEIALEVALGYTCHLVQMISYFLDMPLRYPMDHRGSKSRITDHILDKLSDRERDFPIYSKGKEKFHFEYGVYLLNKNIAQLRYYCGLGTTDLRLTLPNLKMLLQLRLGVKFDHYEPYDPTQDATRQQQYASLQSSHSESFVENLEPKKQNSKNERKDSYHSTPKPKNWQNANNECVEGSDGGLSPVKTDTSGINTGSHGSSVVNGNFHKDDGNFHKDNGNFHEDFESQSDRFSERTSSSNMRDGDIFKPSSDDEDNFFNLPKHRKNENVCGVTLNGEKIHSDEFETFQKKHLCDNQLQQQPTTLQTLEDLMKEKLLGPIANYQDIDVSSSEDSANAVYGSKLWPKMMDNMTIQTDNIPILDDGMNDQFENIDDLQRSPLVKNDAKLSQYDSKSHNKSKLAFKDENLSTESPIEAMKVRTVSENSDVIAEGDVSTFKTSAMHSEKSHAQPIEDMINVDLEKEFDNEDENRVENVSRNVSIVDTGEGLETSESEASFVDFQPTFKIKQ